MGTGFFFSFFFWMYIFPMVPVVEFPVGSGGFFFRFFWMYIIPIVLIAESPCCPCFFFSFFRCILFQWFL